MNYIPVLLSTCLVASMAFLPMPSEQVNAEETRMEVSQWAESKWANVNRITFTDEHSSFNSGVLQLKKGQTATIHTTVDYSGDLVPILQSDVRFEQVDPALSIDYDANTLKISHRQASFTFTVTLNQEIAKPALFTVKVADRIPDDHHHLTPYSQRQTIEQAVDEQKPPEDLGENPSEKPGQETDPTPEPDTDLVPDEQPSEEETKEEEIVLPEEKPEPAPEEQPVGTPDPGQNQEPSSESVPVTDINENSTNSDTKPFEKTTSSTSDQIKELNNKETILPVKESSQSDSATPQKVTEKMAKTIPSEEAGAARTSEEKIDKQLLPKTGESQINNTFYSYAGSLFAVGTILLFRKIKKNRS
ncbi:MULTISPECIES: LPXTG cell wall anchor domain-containing protein [unclassified Enterococcus]|uniref:LPXTG cell wall anchor domain-containing protein n=1 Tax=unclassified Enterococcus TaxID=2608891 RepID=UPI0013ED3439|nr:MULTISPECIES: LPXTG cell wall anchor domain-containing protein [unclassified Enterococcus]